MTYSLVQDHAVLGQEHALASRIAFENEIPLSGRNRKRVAAIDADPDLGELDGKVGALVVTPLMTANITPFLRWLSGDLVTQRSVVPGTGPFSVFSVVGHAHRTAGFFKVRGININHAELEDFVFRNPAVNDFKCEALTVADLDVLRVSIEVRRGASAGDVAESLQRSFRDTFGLTPEIAVLETGTLAKEFEASVKTPRFMDRRQ